VTDKAQGVPSDRSRFICHVSSVTLNLSRLANEEDNLLVTTSGNWYEPAFLCTLLALGADNILFAVDWPYEANTTGVEFLKKLSISDLDRDKIAHLNAERLLKL
jgi:2,3-dihydroxybenzoate decarboxylase